MSTDKNHVYTDLPSDRLVKWVLDLGFSTGHADTEQELLEEVGCQIRELQGKYRKENMSGT